MTDDDGTCTEAELLAMGIDPDDVQPHHLMPWREFSRRELVDAATALIDSCEAALNAGEDLPCEWRMDLSALISVDEAPHVLRMRAARLVRGFSN